MPRSLLRRKERPVCSLRCEAAARRPPLIFHLHFFCGILRHKLDPKGPAEALREALQCLQRRRYRPAFDPADVGLTKPGPSGEFFLGHLTPSPGRKNSPLDLVSQLRFFPCLSECRIRHLGLDHPVQFALQLFCFHIRPSFPKRVRSRCAEFSFAFL